MDLKIWTLSQSWPTPDKVAEDYSHINQTLGHPAVVIDNGSACRAGWYRLPPRENMQLPPSV
eukprot:m.591760 g.591760  ORF g.591760 m.591760 type:complete len:62 (+) comp22384_c0_seq5:235-420(+)